MAAKRTPTDPSLAPPPPEPAPTGRRPRARRETAELPAMTRARTAGFWSNRQPRAISESVTVIATDPPKPKSTRAPTARAKRPTTGTDDFLEEGPTNVAPEE